MTFVFNILSVCGLIGFIIILVLAGIVWTRRPSPGIIPMTLLMLATSIWVLANAFEVSSTQVAVSIWCNKISYIGISSTGVFWLFFTLDYSGSDWWRKPRNIILVSIIPFIGLVIAWTNELHGWQWTNVYQTTGPLGSVFVWDRGPVAWLNIVYQYVLSFIGIVILIRFTARRPPAYKKQAALIITGLLLPMVGTLIYSLRLEFTGGMEVTPIGLVLASILYSIAVLRYRFPNIIPVAYQTIIQNFPDGFLILNVTGEIIHINPVTEKITGQPKRYLLGKNVREIWPDLYNLVSGFPERLHAELTAGVKEKPVYLDAGAVSLYDGRHNTVGKLVVLRDVTEIRTIQQELKNLYEKEHNLRHSLEKEINNRSQYTRALVHELGTPLTSIIASAELLEDMASHPTQLSLVKNILRSSSNLEKRVNELLDLARGELGIIKLELELLDMSELAREVISEMHPLAAEQGVELKSEFSGKALPIMADKQRIRQVIINLLSNALKFTYKGSIVVKDDLDDTGFVKIQVIDTGIGMNQEQLDNLFNPYYHQIKDEARNSGLGIGLSLSKIFIELHHGKIWAESAPGQGATLSFTIPRSSSTPSA